MTQAGRISQLLGLLLLVPAAVAVALGEGRQAVVFAGVAAALWTSGRLAARRRSEDIGFTEGLVLTALAYLLAAAAGATCYLPAVGFVDGFFEAMSGFTTTGLSVVSLSGLPRSLVFFRAFSQWVGGAGIVVLTLAVLLRSSKPAHRLYVSEADDTRLLGSVRSSARMVAVVYLVLTAAAVVALAAAGMGPFDAVVHAMTTVSTGGFSSHPESLGHVPDRMVPLVTVVLMLAGATSFPLLASLRREGWRFLVGDPQTRVMATVVVAAGALAWLASGSGVVLTPVFHAVSALTTTGFSLSDPAGWSPAMRSLTVVLMIVGGSAGSTAGGIKLIRLLLLLRLGGWLLARTLLPEEARVPVRHRQLVVSEADLLNMTAFVVIYLVILTVSMVALTFAGVPLADAVFESASALGTVGLSTGVTSAALPFWAKAVLILDMWLGRLEIVPVLVLLYPGTWRTG